MRAIIYVLAILTIVSCTEKLDVDYKGKTDNELVVYGGITTDTTTHTIELKRAIDYNSAQQPMVTGAYVTISDGNNVFELSESDPGIYQTAPWVYGVPGTAYQLNIELNGEIYSAIDTMPATSPIDSIKIRKELFPFDENYYHKLYFYGQENPKPGNYYRWDVYINDSLRSDTLSEINFQPDDWVNGIYIIDFDVYWLPEYNFPQKTSKVELKMSCISHAYYYYLYNTLSESAWRGGPYDPIPANVPSNVENALGFFFTKAISRKSVIYKRE